LERVLIPVSASFLVCTPAETVSPDRLADITLPPGFSIHVFADAVPGARSLTLSPGGVLYVGTRDEGKVYAVTDADGDRRADAVLTVASGLRMPNGVAFRDGSLYVAEVSRVLRYDRIEESLDAPPRPVVVNDTFPRDRHHGWKFIRFGPDGKLYVPVGAPCNVCEREDARYAAILRMNPDGSGQEVFARGIRNTVGFDWDPRTEELWFTDNGRDWLGDDAPPDELNHAPVPGMHFGFPHCHGPGIPDPEFGRNVDCADYTPPARSLGPHVASLGMRFYTGGMFPETYRNQIFIAEHGSWNRSTPLGYRITLVRLEDNRAVSYEPFAEGWLRDGEAWGRPVDLLVLPDGSLLVSDDRAGAVYRIVWTG
jgi:glucose/arabinose dehydrogenase